MKRQKENLRTQWVLSGWERKRQRVLVNSRGCRGSGYQWSCYLCIHWNSKACVIQTQLFFKQIVEVILSSLLPKLCYFGQLTDCTWLCYEALIGHWNRWRALRSKTSLVTWQVESQATQSSRDKPVHPTTTFLCNVSAHRESLWCLLTYSY